MTRLASSSKCNIDTYVLAAVSLPETTTKRSEISSRNGSTTQQPREHVAVGQCQMMSHTE